MAGEVLYLDSSALVKLVRREAETDALVGEITDWRAHATSVIGAVEVQRAANRAGADPARVDELLRRLSLLDVDDGVRELASTIAPGKLRTLDAIHLASAISLEDDLGALACYDEQLRNAAAREGIPVLSPV